jgi:hypothetical protein
LTASGLNLIPASGKTPADWEEKAASIQAKKDYFAYKLKEGSLSDADTAKFTQFIKDLDEFDTEGRAYG